MKKSMVIFCVSAVIRAASGMMLMEMSATEGQKLLMAYCQRYDYNTGYFGDDVAKLLPFKFKLDSGVCRYVLSEAEYHYADGMLWHSYAPEDGSLKQLGVATGTKTFWFQPYQLFLIKRESGQSELLYCNEGRQGVINEKPSEKKDGMELNWNIVVEDASGELAPEPLKMSIGTIVAGKDVSAIVRLNPYLYKGKSAKYIEPKRERRVREYSTFTLPQKQDVAQLYVIAHENRATDEKRDSVLMIVGDMNGDGLCDAYVSSGEESFEGKQYSWELYSGALKRFVDTEEVIKIQSFEKAIVPATVDATVDDFYLIDRLTGERYVAILKMHNGRNVPTGYLDKRNIVRKRRSECGHEEANYYDCLRSAEERGIGNLDDLFTDHQAPLESMRRLKVEKLYTNINNYVPKVLGDANASEVE